MNKDKINEFIEMRLHRWARILALIVKEFHSIWRDPKSRAMIIMPPIMQLCIFAYAATFELKNISMAIYDKSNTPISRELTHKFEASRWFTKIYHIDNYGALKNLVDNQKVLIALTIPADFSRKINTAGGSVIQLIVDGRKTNSGQIAAGYTASIVEDFGKDIMSKTTSEAVVQNNVIHVIKRNWYNPNLHYHWYTVICLIGVLSMLVAVLLSSLSVAREKEFGTFDQILVTPLKPHEIVLGKVIAPLCFAVVAASIILFADLFIFKIPFAGSFLLLYLSLILFLLAIVSVGLFISSMCRTQQQAILGVFIFMFPTLLLSGYITPVENMPDFVQKMTVINPLKHYLILVKGIYLKGMPLSIAAENLIPIAMISAVALVFATWFFEKKLD